MARPDLPSEILGEILGHTSPRTASRFLATNKVFREEYYAAKAEEIAYERDAVPLRKRWALTVLTVQKEMKDASRTVYVVDPRLSFLFGLEFPRSPEGLVMITPEVFRAWVSLFGHLNYWSSWDPSLEAMNYLERLLDLPPYPRFSEYRFVVGIQASALTRINVLPEGSLKSQLQYLEILLAKLYAEAWHLKERGVTHWNQAAIDQEWEVFLKAFTRPLVSK